jgi:virginiamycin B lyase
MRQILAAAIMVVSLVVVATADVRVQDYPAPPGSRPHDVAPGPGGVVWYTAQPQGALGTLNPATGAVTQLPLGDGSHPHGVIAGPDGAAWITDSGLNAIVRVDPRTADIKRFPLPADRPHVNLNTATFDKRGILWFTGQYGVYGRLDPRTGDIRVWDAPKGRGPYGIATTPDGHVYYASLAGSHIARIDVESGEATVIEPPTPKQGARRVWSDSKNRVWVSEWNSGQVSVYDPAANAWRAWRVPGSSPRVYAVYVDERDVVWLSDWGANALVSFDPKTERFESYPHARRGANVRQILGRPGEVWAPESGTDRLMVLRTK